MQHSQFNRDVAAGERLTDRFWHSLLSALSPLFLFSAALPPVHSVAIIVIAESLRTPAHVQSLRDRSLYSLFAGGVMM